LCEGNTKEDVVWKSIHLH